MKEIIKYFIGSAEELGALNAQSVWAFFTLVLIGYILYDMKIKKKSSEDAWAARIEEAKADVMIAGALEKLADDIKELRHDLSSGGHLV